METKKANQEHLRELKKGVSAWNNWRNVNPDIVPNLIYADLRNNDLMRINLRRARLAGVQLQEATLIGADLSYADLSLANLERANLHQAELYQANLQQAILNEADLSEASLLCARLTHASLVGANLCEANLGSASIEIADLQKADLSQARLDSADFYGANLRKADFSKATLIRVNFSYADLTEANLSKATLGFTIFGATCLTDAIGLDRCLHRNYSIVDHLTVAKTFHIPRTFLRQCQLPEELIKYLISHFQFYSCFISYSRADQDFAIRLHHELENRGIRCWRDEHEILPGDDIMDQIDLGIRLWDKVLLCCSKSSLQSPWVNREIDKALKKEEKLWKERGKKTLSLIPLNLDNYLYEWDSSRASILTDRHTEDLVGWDQNPDKLKRALIRIEKALRLNEGGRRKPPKALI
jgi:Uncharacterized low-complexity proteins